MAKRTYWERRMESYERAVPEDVGRKELALAGVKLFKSKPVHQLYVGYLGRTLDNAFDYSGKTLAEVGGAENVESSYDLHLVRRDGMLINVASAMANLMFTSTKEGKAVYNLTIKYKMRRDWHEPDESEITGKITSDGFLVIYYMKIRIFSISVEKLGP